MQLSRKSLPWLMVWFRLLMAFVLLGDAWDGVTGWPFVFGLGLALASDIFDGILARGLDSATTRLRQADSAVDSVLILASAASAWLAHRQVVLDHGPLVLAMFAFYFASQLPALLRFGKAAAFHAYSAKASGLAFIPAGVLIFGFDRGGWVLDAALWIAILGHIERFLIGMLLPAWQTDVAWLGEALRIRRAAGQ